MTVYNFQTETGNYFADHVLVHNCDLHARHAWLVGKRADITRHLEGDPNWFDAKIAGWWCWGMCCWIGGGFCSGEGPWQVVDGKLLNVSSNGRGVNRQLVHLGDAGRGGNGMQTTKVGQSLYDWMNALAERLRRVRVCCGDWSRVCGPTPTTKQGLTAVFLDPPYSHAERDDGLYRIEDDCGAKVREWAIANGDNKLMRIALCGYEGEHEMPKNWDCHEWKAQGGMANEGNGKSKDNCHRERIWFSPHCVPIRDLFSELNHA